MHGEVFLQAHFILLLNHHSVPTKSAQLWATGSCLVRLPQISQLSSLAPWGQRKNHMDVFCGTAEVMDRFAFFVQSTDLGVSCSLNPLCCVKCLKPLPPAHL